MLSQETENSTSTICQDILKKAADNYGSAVEKGALDQFSISVGASDELLMLGRLNFKDNNLCGVLGRCYGKIKGFVRERDTTTLETREITPSSANSMFETYTYFVLSGSERKIAYMRSGGIGRDIPGCIIAVLKKCIGGAPYEIELEEMYETDIEKKLSELGDRITITGTIDNVGSYIAKQMPSFAAFERGIGTPFRAKAKFSAKKDKRLTQDQIRTILSLSAVDGYSSIKFEDEDEAHEVIDVIKKNIAFSKNIDIDDAEMQDANCIWGKILANF